MVDGLRADMRTIVNIRTMRYALVGVGALLFTVTALAAWLPQYYERHMHMAEGTGEALFMGLIILGGIPGVLMGGRVADRYAPASRAGASPSRRSSSSSAPPLHRPPTSSARAILELGDRGRLRAPARSASSS